jgi:hypothetical protein
MDELAKAAYQLAEEIRDGHWDHINDLATKPAQDCQEIIAALSQRCPGYTQEQYKRAISTGLFVSR